MGLARKKKARSFGMNMVDGIKNAIAARILAGGGWNGRKTWKSRIERPPQII